MLNQKSSTLHFAVVSTLVSWPKSSYVGVEMSQAVSSLSVLPLRLSVKRELRVLYDSVSQHMLIGTTLSQSANGNAGSNTPSKELKNVNVDYSQKPSIELGMQYLAAIEELSYRGKGGEYHRLYIAKVVRRKMSLGDTRALDIAKSFLADNTKRRIMKGVYLENEVRLHVWRSIILYLQTKATNDGTP